MNDATLLSILRHRTKEPATKARIMLQQNLFAADPCFAKVTAGKGCL